MGVYHIMTINKILRKRVLIDRNFHDRHCPIKLWWELKEPLCRAWLDSSHSGYTPFDDFRFPRAIQITARAALKTFPKRQIFGNLRDNTQQNGEHSCFCNITWAQISWRMVRFLLWLPTGAVVGQFCPQRYASSMFPLGLSSPRWRSYAITNKTDLEHAHVKSSRVSPVSKQCFGFWNT